MPAMEELCQYLSHEAYCCFTPENLSEETSTALLQSGFIGPGIVWLRKRQQISNEVMVRWCFLLRPISESFGENEV